MTSENEEHLYDRGGEVFGIRNVYFGLNPGDASHPYSSYQTSRHSVFPDANVSRQD